MTCARCRALSVQLEQQRALTLTLWEELKIRYRLASGTFDLEPVPPLRMRTGAVIEPAEEAA